MKPAAPSFLPVLDEGARAHKAGRLVEAEQAYRRVLQMDDSVADAWHLLGVIRQQQNLLEEAEQLIRKALSLREEALFHDNLALVLVQTARHEQAETHLQRSLELLPARADAHLRLGNVRFTLGRHQAAEACYRSALDLAPRHVEAWSSLGAVLRVLGRPDASVAASRKALALSPHHPDASANLGALLDDIGALQEGEQVLRQALKHSPDDALLRMNLGAMLMRAGRLEEGWPLLEARHAPRKGLPSRALPDIPFPRWNGEPLEGKSLVVWHEAGFGDVLQFIRYAPVLRKQGLHRLTVVCSAPLRDLLRSVDGVDEVLVQGEPMVFHDHWVPVMSIPLHLGTTAQTIPADLPYLRPDAQRASAWRARLPKGIKVGIAWKGAAAHGNDSQRSLPSLETLAPLWSVPGITFISLQKGRSEEEAEKAPPSQPLVPLGRDIQDFSDLAAVVSQLDLVICVDTALAHLAGALKVPVWVLLPALGTDWRWLRDRTDSPWYPQVMRLHRQAPGEDWASVVARVAQALQGWPWPRARAAYALGERLASQGNIREAETAYREAVEAEPGMAAAHNGLGIVLARSGRFAEAEACYRRALAAEPSHVPSLNNLGGQLVQRERAAEALPLLERAAQLRPTSGEIANALGSAQMAVGDLEAADKAYRHALALVPGHVGALGNHGLLLTRAGRFDEAEARFRAALALRPDDWAAWSNLGQLLRDAGRLDEAEAACRRALQLRPDHAGSQRILGALLLAMGRFEQAWPFHDARFAARGGRAGAGLPTLPFPRWQGEPLQGKSLLLWPEQGFGDYIQFIRYARNLKTQGLARLTVHCSAALAPLFETLSAIDHVVTQSAQAGRQDHWSLPMDLPRYCGTTLGTIPGELPYLRARPDRWDLWKGRLLSSPKRRVGLVWRGSRAHRNDTNRSIPSLGMLAPLWDVADVQFVSLQKEDAALEASAPPPAQPIIAIGHEIRDFADTAAIVAELDLVICVDTAVAHVAGALGRPVWVLLPALYTDWRWGHGRNDSPWYPGVMRLFRQARPGEWGSLIEEVAIALREWVASPRP